MALSDGMRDDQLQGAGTQGEGNTAWPVPVIGNFPDTGNDEHDPVYVKFFFIFSLSSEKKGRNELQITGTDKFTNGLTNW